MKSRRSLIVGLGAIAPGARLVRFQLRMRATDGEIELGAAIEADGLSEVFEARWRGERVLVERLRERWHGDAAVCSAWRDDADAARELRWSGVLGVLEAFEGALGPTVVRPFCDGGPVSSKLPAPRGDPQLGPVLGVALLEALEGVHRAGLVHRALGASQVWLDGSGAVQLMGLGLGRARKLALGAASWARSPEEVRGQPFDTRSDLFLAGLLIFEWCTGALPMRGTVDEALAQLAEGTLQPALEARGELDPALAAVLDRAVAPAPGARFQSASTFAAALSPFVSEAARARLRALAAAPGDRPPARSVERAAPAATQAPAGHRRRRAALLAALAVGAAAALALGGALSLRGAEAPHRPRAGEVLLVHSRPPGATVAVDGRELPACSPCEVPVRQGQVVHLSVTTLHYSHERSWSGPVKDARSVSVDLTDLEPHVVVEPREPAAVAAGDQLL